MPSGGSRRHLRRVFEKLVSCPAAGRTRFDACFRQVEAQLVRKGIVVVLSDFMDEPNSLARDMGRLRLRGHDVIAFQVFEGVFVMVATATSVTGVPKMYRVTQG